MVIRRTLLTLAALGAAAVLVVAGCSGSGSTAATAAPAGATTGAAPASAAAACAVVAGTGTAAQIKGFAFPGGLSVQAGQSISWTNGDTANHTITFDDGSCSIPVDAGATVTVQYSAPGTHAFHCSIHPSMKGSLEVKG
jgi:plastocyanin